MNPITKLYNKYVRYRHYNKETQLSLEDKIGFLEIYNSRSVPNIDGYANDGKFTTFCWGLMYYMKLSKFPLIKIEDHFIELAYYAPIPYRITLYRYGFSIWKTNYWFEVDEKGWEERKKICNDLIGKLQEKERRINRGEI